MNINVKLDNSYEQRFREIKILFKIKTNDETIKRIMDLAQQQIQSTAIFRHQPPAIIPSPQTNQ